MNEFLTTLTLSFTPQTVFGMLGSLLGAFIASDKKRYGVTLSFMFILAAVAFGAAMGEYLTFRRGITSIFWLFVLNVPLGMIVGSTLDVLRISSPPLIEKLVNGIGNSGVNIIVESVLGKLSKWFGVTVPEQDYKGSKGHYRDDGYEYDMHKDDEFNYSELKDNHSTLDKENKLEK